MFVTLHSHSLHMKRVVSIILLIITFIPINSKAQLVQFGTRFKTDVSFQNVGMGLEADLNLPIVCWGMSVSGILDIHNFNTNMQDILKGRYVYLTLPINAKYRIGFGVVKVILMGGIYVSIPMDDSLKDELLLEKRSKATLVGINGQFGIEFLKHYRISFGYRADLYKSDMNKFIDEPYGVYIDLMYIL